MTTTPIDKAALAERLTRLSDELHEAAGDMFALGWTAHSEQLGYSGSMVSLYGHQLRARVRLDAEPGDGA